MLTKMYRLMYIVFIVNLLHADAHSIYLVFQNAYMFLFDNNSIRTHEYKFDTTITIQFGESLQSKLSSSFMLNTLVLFTYFDVRSRLSIFDLRLLSDRRTILIGRGPHLAMISNLGAVLV